MFTKSLSLRIRLCLILLLSAMPVRAEYSYPGGIAQIEVDKQSQELPEAKFGLSDGLILESKDAWRILIGLDLNILPGEYVVYFKHAVKGTSGEHLGINVKQKNYDLVGADMVQSTTMDQAVHLEVSKQTVFSSIDFSNSGAPSLPLALPLECNWDNKFGQQILARDNTKVLRNNAVSCSINGQENVVAPQNAIVSHIEIDENQIATMVLDHGRGLYSILTGLTDLSLELGNGVVKGAVIGRLAMNEQNQSKLIWQTILTGVAVDPSILTRLR